MTFAQYLDWLSALLDFYEPRHTQRGSGNTAAEETALATALNRYEPHRWSQIKQFAGNPSPA